VILGHVDVLIICYAFFLILPYTMMSRTSGDFENVPCPEYKSYMCFVFNRCGSIDSVYGPVRNPWKYKFKSQQSQSSTETVSPGNHQTLVSV